MVGSIPPEEPPTPQKKIQPPKMSLCANRTYYFSKFFDCGGLLFYPYYENVF